MTDNCKHNRICGNIGDCRSIDEVVDRLAAYEDTGLTPEELRELTKAKEEGRLVMLPCKVGDTVWISVNGEPIECVLTDALRYKAKNYNLEILRSFDGKINGEPTVFTSKETAEKALGGGSDGSSKDT